MSYPYQKGNKVFEPLVALAIATFGKEAIEQRGSGFVLNHARGNAIPHSGRFALGSP